MKSLKTKTYLSALGLATVLATLSTQASAGVDVTNWQLNLNALSTTYPTTYASLANVVTTGINNLSFNGESYVVNTPVTNQPGIYTSTDVGVFNVIQKNGGVPLALGGGQLTAYFQATDLTNINTGAFTFTSGTLAIYYNSALVYGTTAANNYGATAGTQIATFNIANTGNPNTGGGFVNPNGTPQANGTVTITGQAPTTLTPSNIFLDSNGNPFNQNILLSFVTSNASEDLSANPNTASNPNQYSIDPNLVLALTGTAGTTNTQTSYFITNGGQFKLQYAPEPMTIALFGVGLLAMGLTLRRRVGLY